MELACKNCREKAKLVRGIKKPKCSSFIPTDFLFYRGIFQCLLHWRRLVLLCLYPVLNRVWIESVMKMPIGSHSTAESGNSSAEKAKSLCAISSAQRVTRWKKVAAR
jgi:hypothetical protein